MRGSALLRLRGAQGTSSGAAGIALGEKHGVRIRNNSGEEIWNIFGGRKHEMPYGGGKIVSAIV